MDESRASGRLFTISGSIDLCPGAKSVDGSATRSVKAIHSNQRPRNKQLWLGSSCERSFVLLETRSQAAPA